MAAPQAGSELKTDEAPPDRRRLGFFLARSAPRDLLEAVGRLAGSEIVELEKLPELDLCLAVLASRVGHALRPFQRLGTRLHLDRGEAGDELLALGEGPVDHLAPAAGKPDPHALRGRQKARGVEKDAGPHQLLVKIRHVGHALLVGHLARLAVLVRFHQDHETHRRLLGLGWFNRRRYRDDEPAAAESTALHEKEAVAVPIFYRGRETMDLRDAKWQRWSGRSG